MTASDLLDVSEVDVEALVLARNDVHPLGDWWFDPRTGTCLYLGVDDDSDLPALAESGHVLVPRAPQPASDVDDFLAALADGSIGVDDEVVARLLGARRGKGGLRRFREVVVRTDAAELWAGYVMRREVVRAVVWLLEREMVEPTSAARLLEDLRAPSW